MVLGSTGSVGSSAVNAIEAMPGRFRASVLVAHSSAGTMLEQALRVDPDIVALTKPEAAESFSLAARREGLRCEVLSGEDGIDGLARDAGTDDVVVATSGILGLRPTLSALGAGKRVLTANKESVVVGGALMRHAVREHGGSLIPIDSEHNALFQLMGLDGAFGAFPAHVRRIVLTASGGPFRGHTREQLGEVSPRQAFRHPVWQMGKKISVDSATLMNKGLEVIEANRLFGADPERIRVVVHPECVIHAIVELVDGNSLAHLGTPDMGLPIRSALAHPERVAGELAVPAWDRLGSITFEPPDLMAFPCLGLAYEALRLGGTAPLILNAANEVAVEAFIGGRIRLTGIPEVIEHGLRWGDIQGDGDCDALVEADKQARDIARRWMR